MRLSFALFVCFLTSCAVAAPTPSNGSDLTGLTVHYEGERVLPEMLDRRMVTPSIPGMIYPKANLKSDSLNSAFKRRTSPSFADVEVNHTTRKETNGADMGALGALGAKFGL